MHLYVYKYNKPKYICKHNSNSVVIKTLGKEIRHLIPRIKRSSTLNLSMKKTLRCKLETNALKISVVFNSIFTQMLICYFKENINNV